MAHHASVFAAGNIAICMPLALVGLARRRPASSTDAPPGAAARDNDQPLEGAAHPSGWSVRLIGTESAPYSAPWRLLVRSGGDGIAARNGRGYSRLSRLRPGGGSVWEIVQRANLKPSSGRSPSIMPLSLLVLSWAGPASAAFAFTICSEYQRPSHHRARSVRWPFRRQGYGAVLGIRPTPTAAGGLCRPTSLRLDAAGYGAGAIMLGAGLGRSRHGGDALWYRAAARAWLCRLSRLMWPIDRKLPPAAN